MRFPSWSQISASFALVLGLALSLSIVGCGSDSSPVAPTSGWENDSGTLALGIRVAADDITKSGGSPPVPEGIAELYLTFETITAFKAPAERDSSCDSSGTGSSSIGSHGDGEAVPVEILIEPVTLEILALGETLTTLLAEAELPDGRYMKIELGLVDAWAVTDSGVSVPVGLPPAGDSLFKVISPFSVVNGEATALVLEIDLGRSLRESPPGSGELVLRPVIRATIVPHGEAYGWARHNGEEYGQGEGENCQGGEEDRGLGGSDEHGQSGDDEHGRSADGEHGMGESGATGASWGGSTGQGGSENGSGGSASDRSGGNSDGASSGH